MFIGKLKVLEEQSLLSSRDEMFIHQSFCELLLVITKLIFIKVELVISRDVWRS